MGQPPNPYVIRETPNEGINIENIEAVGSYAIALGGSWFLEEQTDSGYEAVEADERFVHVQGNGAQMERPETTGAVLLA